MPRAGRASSSCRATRPTGGRCWSSRSSGPAPSRRSTSTARSPRALRPTGSAATSAAGSTAATPAPDASVVGASVVGADALEAPALLRVDEDVDQVAIGDVVVDAVLGRLGGGEA